MVSMMSLMSLMSMMSLLQLEMLNAQPLEMVALSVCMLCLQMHLHCHALMHFVWIACSGGSPPIITRVQRAVPQYLMTSQCSSSKARPCLSFLILDAVLLPLTWRGSQA